MKDLWHKRFFIVVMVYMTSQPFCYGQSVLHSGNWFKFSVDRSGVYQIDFNLLKKAGIDPASINPKKIKIYGQGGGMLPQLNAAGRPIDLVENAIQVTGENDGKFDGGDRIIFYAEGADEAHYDNDRGSFYYQHNLYADKNFYFITISDEDGKRITQDENIAGNFPLINTFNDFVFHEADEHNELTSGREWFGEKFEITTEHKFSFDLPGIVSGSSVTWVTDVMAQNPPSGNSGNSIFKLFFNNVEVGQQEVFPSSVNRYGVKGIQNRDTLTIATTAVGASAQSTQEITYQYTKATSRSIGYLNFFLINVVRELALYEDQTMFVSSESLDQPVSSFRISQLPASASLWNITDPGEPSAQSFTLASGTGSFSTVTSSLQEFIVFNDNIPFPEFVEKISNQNLHGLETPNLLIITHPDFRPEAERLATHRQNHSQLNTHVVSVFEIYNEFSSGRQDVSAIRDFIRSLYLKNPSALKSVLFFGRGSYDYKNRVNNNTNFVPTYESYNSLHPLLTYSSDDFYGFMDSEEGLWQESPPTNHTLDIAVGRIPVKTSEEAGHVVDKIIDYETNKKKFGRWRKEITFVADDGNTEDNFSNVHQSQANTLAEFIENEYPSFDTKKIFIGTYPKEVKPSGETATSVNDAIAKAFARGTLIINFTGHGSEKVWADERILTDVTIPELTNKIYPFMITATCEFGRQDDPAQISSAELCLIQKNSGAIGLVSTARPVNSSTNFELNDAFYTALFEKENNTYRAIGEVFRRTKNNSTSGVSNRNFSLIGDPSMHLALPQQRVVVNTIETEGTPGTLTALSKVTVRGEIQDEGGTIQENYSGTLEATLFDKRTDFKTNGKSPFSFQQWHNALFRGQASVRDGAFEFQFIVPKNIAYEAGQGKLSLYASDPEDFMDAAGADLDLVIGGSNPGALADDTSPEIRLFIGDTTFVNGGITNPDTYLVARLNDASGINISSYGIGNDLMATLDDSETFVLNDYYIADPDDFTSGYVSYPMTGLSPGKHTIVVKAWDTHNNPSEATIDFIVTDGKQLIIESFGNYPNPARESTTFYFTHNRFGDDLQAEFFIFNAHGMIQKNISFSILESSYRVEFPELDLKNGVDKYLAPGLYLVRLVVRSLTNASKNEQVTKLIILN